MRKLERLKQKDAVHTQDIGDLKKIHLRQKTKKIDKCDPIWEKRA